MIKVLITKGAKCPQFNIVRAQKLYKLQIAQIIVDAQKKKAKL